MPQNQIQFKFYLDQEVVTPFDEKGLISMLSFDDSGIVYYVKTKVGGEWFKEKDLKEKIQ